MQKLQYPRVTRQQFESDVRRQLAFLARALRRAGAVQPRTQIDAVRWAGLLERAAREMADLRRKLGHSRKRVRTFRA